MGAAPSLEGKLYKGLAIGLATAVQELCGGGRMAGPFCCRRGRGRGEREAFRPFSDWAAIMVAIMWGNHGIVAGKGDGWTVLDRKFFVWRASLAALVVALFLPAAALAAGVNLTGVRFGRDEMRERIVFDVSALPRYKARVEGDGRRIVLEIFDLADRVKIKPAIIGDLVQRVAYRKSGKNLLVTIDLAAPAPYEINTLAHPQRLYIDFQKQYESRREEIKAPGLKLTTYLRRDGRGPLTAYFLEVDTKRYQVFPVLANGQVLGRGTVSDMADEIGAAAAINASYFAPDGTILGVLRLAGEVAGTTYFTRTALGIEKNGKPFVAPVYYDAKVRIGKAVQPVSGVNIPRGENNLVIYNRLYNDTTETNQFGREFTVRNGKVAAIHGANSPIPEDGYVISVHGAARDAFVRVRVGDEVELTEDLGSRWRGVPTILGAGPLLVKNGRAAVQAEAEDFPADIAVGRAPRTGVAVLGSRRLLLAVVDGRQESSIGCTLEEFAELLIKFGAREAVNFDGGGSSAMSVGGDIVNAPSDGRERSVGSALAVMEK